MPALAFGLKGSKAATTLAKPAPKRKAFSSFDDDDDDDDDDTLAPLPPQATKKTLGPIKPLSAFNKDEDEDDRPSKSPKLTHPDSTTDYTSLSSRRNAALEDARVASVDSSVYDYDGAYSTFSSSSKPPKSSNGSSDKPKYMTHLLASSAQRSRDLMRAKERLVQKERENEGVEFADKEKFVTGAYKQQQEEMRVAEIEEAKKREEEERRRGRGEGMVEFQRGLLRREDERMRGIEKREEEKLAGGEAKTGEEDEKMDGVDADEDEVAKELNEKGARIVVNDEGEVIDKRQLLSAGLNAVPKKAGQTKEGSKVPLAEKSEHGRTSTAQGARQAQRERQTRMMEKQLESMAEQQEADAEREEAERAEKNKTKVTEEKKMDAKERYLARKREKEEAEKVQKGG